MVSKHVAATSGPTVVEQPITATAGPAKIKHEPADPQADEVAQPKPVSTLRTTAHPPVSASLVGDRYAIPAKKSVITSSSSPKINEKPPTASMQSPSALSAQVVKHNDAVPASATVDIAPQKARSNVRRAIWLLGSRLSYAALAHDRGMAADKVPGWFDEARAQAKMLGTSVPELPAPATANDKSPASEQVIDYLLVQGKRLSSELSQRYGADRAALLEVALKANILLLIYSPGTSEGNSISAAISRAAPQAGLPADLWKPLIDLIALQAPLSDVQAAVRQMNSEVEKYLAKAAEPNGR
ncbi:MAG TPA: hypothetical protein VFW73_08795 [Lacipirellulaceae bacterium]|nr:hypothetical protein [Lacipirellulaceae bacterium]